MAKDSGSNRRAHLRYRDPESTVYNFASVKNGGEQDFIGLIVNESFNGMAVVIVGDGNLEPGELILWKEAESIKTECRVIRCIKLDEDIFRLSLSIES
jgi:hypothetical protein